MNAFCVLKFFFLSILSELCHENKCGFVSFFQLCFAHAQSDTAGVDTPFFNQINLCFNYGDVQRFNGNANQLATGFGFYHNTSNTEGLRLQFGFEYNELRQKGVVPSYHPNIEYSNMYSNLYAVGIPINFQYLIGIGNSKLIPEIGAFGEHYIGHQIHGNYRGKGNTGQIENNNAQYSGSAPIAQFNYGIGAGIGINIPHNKLSYVFKLDYKFGFEDLSLHIYQSTIHARYIRFSAGLIFHERKPKASSTSVKDTTREPIFNEYTSSVNFNDIARYSENMNQNGFGVGIYRNSKMRKRFSSNFGIELNQTRFHGGLRSNQTGHNVLYGEMDTRISFITLPTTIRYNIGKRFSVFPEIGIYTDINTDATGNGMHTTADKTKIETSHAEIKFLNFGATAGIGFRIPMGKNHLLLKADYRYGFSDIGLIGYSQPNIFNRYFKLSAGFSFAMKKAAANDDANPFFNEYIISTNFNDLERYNESVSPQYVKESGDFGYGVGIYHNAYLKERLQYQFGIELNDIRSHYKSNYANSVIGVRAEQSTRKVALNIANNLKYYFGKRSVRPFVLIGAYPQLNVIRKRDISVLQWWHNDPSNQSEILSFTEIKTFPSVRIGTNAGVGLRIDTEVLYYTFTVDYNYGGNGNLFALNSDTNRYIRVGIGIGLK